VPKEIQAKVTTVGRPLRLEITLDGPWLDRLKSVLRSMDDGGYPMQRYLEELIEADIVYREAIGCRGPFLSRTEIVQWLQQRHSGRTPRRAAAGGARR
jgi:hypothetical protein